VIAFAGVFSIWNSNERVSMAAWALRLNFCNKEVVNPVGYVNAPIQKWCGVPFYAHVEKNEYLSFKSAIQLARGFKEK